jgi:hypothetical protein
MRKVQLLACLVLGCSTSTPSNPSATIDASLTEVLPSDDASAAPVDAGPLWQPCEPADPESCPTDFECFPAHTAPVDAFHECVIACSDGGAPLCIESGGSCDCPLSVTGSPGDCSPGNDAGAVTVCAPAGDGGPNGNIEVDDASAPYDPDANAGSDASDAGPG